MKPFSFLVLFFLFLGVATPAEVQTDAGTLQGRIILSGNPSFPANQPVTKDIQACGGKSVPTETFVSDGHGGLGNVVAVLQSKTPILPPSPHDFLMDQKECRFVPHILIVPEKSTVEFQNHDSILHHVQIKTAENSSFSQTMPPYTFFKVRMNKPDIFSVGCDLHPWMKAWIFVTNSYFSKLSDEHGGFSFESVPQGHYTLYLWHEFLGTKQIPVDITGGRLARLDVIWTLPVRERPEGIRNSIEKPPL